MIIIKFFKCNILRLFLMDWRIFCGERILRIIQLLNKLLDNQVV